MDRETELAISAKTLHELVEIAYNVYGEHEELVAAQRVLEKERDAVYRTLIKMLKRNQEKQTDI
jgi:urease accessory protein UreE